MGRELRRVPLDFNWPLNEIWDGFLMPDALRPIPCAACNQTGYNEATRKIADDYYDQDGWGVRWRYQYGTAPDGTSATRPPWKVIGDCRAWCHAITQDEVEALVKAGRLLELTHDFTPGEGWKPNPDAPPPTADEVNAWSHAGIGHDDINRGILIEARARRLGVWGLCPRCDGEGEGWRDAEHKASHDAWQESDPPTGDGYQMWETTSEGSPISPVFATGEELARWLADNNASAFGDSGATYAEWLAMIKGSGWAPSAMMVDGGPLESGVAVMARTAE